MTTARKTKNFYDRIADVHNLALKLNGYKDSVAKFLKSLNLDVTPETMVLDAGSGTGIVTLAFFFFFKPAVRGDTVGIILGAWLMASPWLLGFNSAQAAATNAVIIGALVIGYALWAMRIDTTSRDDVAYDTNP